MSDVSPGLAALTPDGWDVADAAGEEFEGGIGQLSVSQAEAVKSMAGANGIAAWAGGIDTLIVGAVTRDANGSAISAAVEWPDGATGTYTATTVSSAFPGTVDAYTVTHVLDGVTLTATQAAVTRDATGAVVTRPAITVA